MKLFKHQQDDVKTLEKKPRVFNMSDPGTGKTGVHITAFSNRRKKKGGKCLVLAPKSLLHAAWGADLRKFAPHLRQSIAYASNRLKALNVQADIYIVNHDGVKALVTLPPAYWKDFDTIIIDESTAYTHRTSQRSKAVNRLVKHFKHRELLSATPTSNGVCDIWHQVNLLDDGQRLGTSFFSFRAGVCTPHQLMRNIVTWDDKPNAEAIVSALISDLTIRHKFEDCVDIPENHLYTVEFELSASHMSAYKELEKECVLYLSKNQTISAVNAAVLYGKLLQVSSGAVYSSTDAYSIVDVDRYELVLDLVEARTHTVVFFNWAHQKELLIAEAVKRKLSYEVFDGSTSDTRRKEIVPEFQAGEYRVLFAHPQSAGHGLTLTKGVATIWASPTHNLEHFLQGLKRIHRIGQTLKTETIVVVAPNTIEEKVYTALMNKDAKMTTLLEYLK